VGSDEERSREVEAQAVRAGQAGRWAAAADLFRNAWAIYKDPWYMCELGTLESMMGKARDSTQSLTTCLRLLNPEDKRAVKSKFGRILKDMRAQVGELTVEANVPDAEVFVDGAKKGTLPGADPIFVDPGSHVVEVKAPGYDPYLMMAVMSAGTAMHIRARLEPMRVEVAPAPPERAPNEAKPNEAKANEPKPNEPKPNEPKPNEEAKPRVPAPLPVLPSPSAKALAPFRSPERAPEGKGEPPRAAVILTGLGLSVAGAVVGTAGFMAAGSAREEAKAMFRDLTNGSGICENDTPGPCADAESKIDTALVLTAVGVAGAAVSAVGGALVVYEFVRSAPQERKASARLAIQPVPGGGALRVTGSF
jgi:hypothetical protein